MRGCGVRIAAVLLAFAPLTGCGSSDDRALKAVTRFEQYYAIRDFTNAREEIKKAIAIQDDVPEYWNKLGRAELGLLHYYPAYVAYERAYELDENNNEALQSMAELTYSGGKREEADRLADKMLAREPRTLRMLLVKGAVALDNRDYPATRALIAKMMSIDPQNEGAIVLLSRVLVLTGDPKRAAAVVEDSIARTGPTRLKLDALIDNYVSRHDLPGIIRTYRRMFEIDRTTVGLRLDYAKALYDNGEPARALSVISQLQRARPHDASLQQQIVDLWNMVGSDAIDIDAVRRVAEAGNEQMKLALTGLAIEKHRYGEAMSILRPFITGDEITPENAAAQVLYARAIWGLGRKDEARTRTDRILEFDDTNPDALLLRVDIAIDRRKFDDALNDAQILGRDNPGSPRARLALARVYVARDERVLADTSFARALGDIGDSVEIARTYIGWLVADGRAPMALDVAKRFVERNPRKLGGWEILGEQCLAQKDRVCVNGAADALAHIHGGDRMRSILIAAMPSAGAAIAAAGGSGQRR